MNTRRKETSNTHGNEAVRVIDVRGVLCPLNFLRVSAELKRMEPGERIEVFLDRGEPLLNVKAGLKRRGHTLLAETDEVTHFRLLIERQ